MLKPFEEFAEELNWEHDVHEKYHEYFRDNAEVGDGATLCMWSDQHAYDIIARTPQTLTLQRCDVRHDPNAEPYTQTWLYASNPNGSIITARWSKKRKCFVSGGQIVIPHREEYFDYSF